jgi:quaternary ammonium compound-resistance protein SugE
MLWIVLVFSGALEAVWAGALAASEGFRKILPTIVFAVTCTASMAGLAWAMTGIPTGTAYAVWTGIGATLTVLWSFVTRQERVSVVRVLLLVLLVSSVIGLKVVS